MIDKNCLPKELHGVYDYFTEENCCSNYLSKSRLLNNVYKGLVRCGRGDDVFDIINLVIELYWKFSGENKAHKIHAIFSGIHGKYEQSKCDIFAALYYLLRRTDKDVLLIEIVESKLKSDLPFAEFNPLGVFKHMIESEEDEHEDFLRNQDAIYQLYGQWNEDDWYDHVKEFEQILSEYTIWRLDNELIIQDREAKEATDAHDKELEVYYKSPEGKAELENFIANCPTFEEIENAPSLDEKKISVQNKFLYFTDKATEVHVNLLRHACQHRYAATRILSLLVEWEGVITLTSGVDISQVYIALKNFCAEVRPLFILEKSFTDAYTRKLSDEREKYCRIF